MTPQRPPRPLRREPFPPAADYVEPPVDVEEEPFPLRAEYVPTMRDLSEQIGAVSAHLTVVHKECGLTRHELGELRQYVMGDHAPRITAVEQSERQSRITIPPGLRKGAAKGAVGLGLAAIYPVAEALWPLIQKLLEGR